MQVHSLGLEDFCEDNYTLIGIHTALEDFKLAYLLNNNLNTRFSRTNYSLDFETGDTKASFSIYDYTNEKYDYEWYLIANSYKEERINESDTLALATETKTYLIPEKKRVDYFIKIVGESNKELITKTVDRINTISNIVTSYTIEPNTLKSKEFLIF
ncbi:IPExxxVDY family protein [Pseudotenacibaculum sp. MALMAid0570]|uniref:IPExxxVDY family protein n=1 Tax=Pseudotenacibaculum sp. MALMAid0570 TaxID=3143938 RepID=UPI0032DFE82C